jgi:large subunit ribosomal protein L15
MVVRIKKKRRRGERTYHGSHKKWRGGGSRGGRGKAGLHKHKWSYVVKYEPEHFGKRGFKRPLAIKKKMKAINLEDLEKISEKLVKKEGEKIKINVINLGYEKVLGKGRITKPLIVEAKFFSKKALEKLEKVGGKAVVIK